MIRHKYLPVVKSRVRCILLAGLVLAYFFLDNPYTISIIGGTYSTQMVKFLSWIGIAFIVWLFPRVHPKGKLRMKGFVTWWAFNFAVIYVAVSVISGLIDAFGRSPYDHSFKGVFLNIVVVGSALIGREFVRSYLVNSLTDDENFPMFILVAFFMTLSTFTVTQFAGLNDYKSIVKFTAQYLAPEFSKNLLAVYLAYLGGPLPAIIYMGAIQAFQWLSPVLPDLKWITSALVGILTPVFSLMVMQNLYLNESKSFQRRDKEEQEPVGWMITSIISIALIWFSVGVFPIYPSVIATGSMEPMTKPGDVILASKVTDVNILQIGDVIQFRRNGISISHRIIEIVEDQEKGVSVFKTKGDNNPAPDTDLVEPEQVKGKIINVIPNVGWPSLLIKSRREIPLDEIEF
ncbi:signal peptidase I [Phosphitispora sp. TUW77]|uniref:signal peptidase I n=1 Tax=Phosphitispora sp. TUW77 TaxID=3152361 RepID=UPI003AB57A12